MELSLGQLGRESVGNAKGLMVWGQEDNVLHLERGLSYTGLCIHQNSLRGWSAVNGRPGLYHVGTLSSNPTNSHPREYKVCL